MKASSARIGRTGSAMSAHGKRLIDHDELERYKPRGLSGGAAQPEARWRTTRLEAEDKGTQTRAVVEEVRGVGWRYCVARAGSILGSGEGLSKERALVEARSAMQRRGDAS